MAADVSAEKCTWRRDVAPLEGCHTSVTHTVTDHDHSYNYKLQQCILYSMDYIVQERIMQLHSNTVVNLKGPV